MYIKNMIQAKLNSNAHSNNGYLWYPIATPSLELIHDYKQPLENYNGCMQVFVFRTTQVGHTRIELQYKRPWDTQVLKVHIEEIFITTP